MPCGEDVEHPNGLPAIDFWPRTELVFPNQIYASSESSSYLRGIASAKLKPDPLGISMSHTFNCRPFVMSAGDANDKNWHKT